MKRSIIIACALAIGSSVGMAEEKTSTQTSATPSAEQYQPQEMRLFDSSMIENKKVLDQDGNDLGKLEKLLIDAESGRVRFAVIQIDKKWSLNDPEVIVPFLTLEISRIGDNDLALKIDATRDKLMNAPHFDKKLVHQLTTREAGEPIYSYWGATWLDDSDSGTAENRPLSTPSTGTTNAPSTTSTSSSPTATTSTTPTDASSPKTTTDGSAGTQSIGNSGTSDSPKPDRSPGQPSTGDLNTEPKSEDFEYESEPLDRKFGGDETD